MTVAMKKDASNFWDLVSPNQVSKPGDYGYNDIFTRLAENMGIRASPRTISLFSGQILAAFYVFFLSYFMYYFISGYNKTSEMMQYIAMCIYLWMIFLGLIIHIYC
jgi:hypothetical protein